MNERKKERLCDHNECVLGVLFFFVFFFKQVCIYIQISQHPVRFMNTYEHLLSKIDRCRTVGDIPWAVVTLS